MVTSVKEQLELVLHQQAKEALAEITTLAVASANATAAHTAKENASECEQRLLQRMHSELSTVIRTQEGSSLSSHQLIESSVAQALKQLQKQLDKRIVAVRGASIRAAETAVLATVERRIQDVDARMDEHMKTIIAEKVASVKTEPPVAMDASWIQEVQRQVGIAVQLARADPASRNDVQDSAAPNASPGVEPPLAAATATAQPVLVPQNEDLNAKIAASVAQSVSAFLESRGKQARLQSSRRHNGR